MGKAGLNVTTTATTKKVVNFFEEENLHPRQKILGTRMRKGPLPYVGMGPPNG